MYALFAAIPLIGHLNPLLHQAEELRDRGWRVAVASTHEAEAHVRAEHPALPFLDLGPLGSIAGALRRNEEAASLDRRFVRGAMRIVRGLTATWPLMFDGLSAAIGADRPDVMVVDLFSPAGMCAAEAARIPLVINNADLLPSLPVTLLPPADHLPFLFSGRSVHAVPRAQRLIAPLARRVAALGAAATMGRDLNRFRRSRGLPPTTLDGLLRGRRTLVCGAFGLEYPRPLPASVEMVGPMLPRDEPPLPAEMKTWLDAGPPVVYANMGTLAVAPPGQLSKMREAFAELDARVLWILKAPQAATLPTPVPANVRILGWGPAPLAVLRHPNVRALVSHCGINSVHESLTAGTPIVGIPMFADQLDMAVRVADAGAGLWLDKHQFSPEALRTAIARVLDDETFRARIPPIQAVFARAGGVRRAADLIQQTAQRGQ